jgi:hypothetical protein
VILEEKNEIVAVDILFVYFICVYYKTYFLPIDSHIEHIVSMRCIYLMYFEIPDVV